MVLNDNYRVAGGIWEPSAEPIFESFQAHFRPASVAIPTHQRSIASSVAW